MNCIVVEHFLIGLKKEPKRALWFQKFTKQMVGQNDFLENTEVFADTQIECFYCFLLAKYVIYLYTTNEALIVKYN